MQNFYDIQSTACYGAGTLSANSRPVYAQDYGPDPEFPAMIVHLATTYDEYNASGNVTRVITEPADGGGGSTTMIGQ